MRINPYWIIERYNPQLGIYYIGKGQMTRSAAKKYKTPGYGVNVLQMFNNEHDYLARLLFLRAAGRDVQ